MSLSFLRVTCGHCGKVLRVNDAHAGKAGRCPNCRGSIKLPSLEDFKKESPPDIEHEGRSCPTCGAYLNPGDVICISCYTNLATGEWDLEKAGYKKPEKQSFPILKIAAGVLIVLVVFMAGHFIQRGMASSSNDDSKNAVVKEIPKGTSDTKKLSNYDKIKKEEEEYLVKEIARLENLPEKNLDELQKKIESYENFFKRLTEDRISFAPKALDKLQEKEINIKVKQIYEDLNAKLNENDLFSDLLILEYFPLSDYKNTPEATKVEQKKKDIVQKILAELKKTKEDADGLVKNGKYKEALVTIFPIPQKMVPLIVYPDLKEKVKEILDICSEANEAQSQITPPDPEKLKKENEEKLKSIEADFKVYLPFYRDLVRGDRDYEKALQKLREFKDAVLPLVGIPPENNDLYNSIAIRIDALEHIQKLLIATGEGIKRYVGKEKIFCIQKSDNPFKIFKGIVSRIEDGQIYMLLADSKIEFVPVKDLKAEDIIQYALEAKDDMDTHMAAAWFAMYETKFSLADRELGRARDSGLYYKTLLTAQAQIAQAKEENEIEVKEKEKEREKAKSDSEDARRKEKIKECVEQSKRILNSELMSCYKRGQWKDGFESLKRIKQNFSSIKLFPYDDLKDLNDWFKEKQGETIGNIADKLLTTCPKCGGKGKVDCSRCWTTDWVDNTVGPGPKGKIKIVVGKVQVAYDPEDVGKEKYDWITCPLCKGQRSLNCNFCYDRRTNRDYQAIKKFFVELAPPKEEKSE